jgi:hypothetical protein
MPSVADCLDIAQHEAGSLIRLKPEDRVISEIPFLPASIIFRSRVHNERSRRLHIAPATTPGIFALVRPDFAWIYHLHHIY